MSHQRRTTTLVAAAIVATLAASLLVSIGSVASAPPVAASTREDGANWVPFIGNYELWCTQSNPGCSGHHNRPAIDIGMPVGTTVRAAGAGTVQRAGNDGDGRGTYVEILHTRGLTSHYYHLSRVLVSPGQRVRVGQVIAKSGNTGSSSAPHLHYEEKNARGRTVEPGIMHSVQNCRPVDYPTSRRTDDWLRLRYGTRIANEGYRLPRFCDVDRSTWNYSAIVWADDNGIAGGYPDRTWRNAALVTRAQAVEWIWRTAGRPRAASTAPHGDVPANAWYRRALDWAAEVPGMIDQFGSTFTPTRRVTRGQLAVMLWARAGRPAAPSAGLTDLPRADQRAAADWMVARGYMTGFGDGTFRPAAALQRGAAIMALYRERLFVDLGERVWNRPAVDWARWRAYLLGYPDHTFKADRPITRAQAVVMLWREAGSPAATEPSGFTDIPPGAWYEAAADWAAETGVAAGYGDGTFRGSGHIQRGALVMMVWREAGSPPRYLPHTFSDVALWLQDGVSWASEHGVVSGYPDATFRGTELITRGQAVNVLNRAAAQPD